MLVSMVIRKIHDNLFCAFNLNPFDCAYMRVKGAKRLLNVFSTCRGVKEVMTHLEDSFSH